MDSELAGKNVVSIRKSRNNFFEERNEYLSHFSIILTSYCNIACKHCMPESGPHSKGENLNVDDLKRVINELGSFGSVKNICFTGGEPFTHLKLLVEGAATCKDNNLNVTVMTNGFWAKDIRKAKEMLLRIPNLVHVGFSTDKFHLEYLSIKLIVNGIKACNELGLSCSVRVSYLDSYQSEIDEIVQLLSEVDGQYILEHQPVQDYGRAATQISSEQFLSLSTSETVCASSDVHALNFDGRVMACCGPSINWKEINPLSLGNINEESINTILVRANQNLILQIIRLWGPYKLIEIAEEFAKNNQISYQSLRNHTMCRTCEFVTNDPLTLAILKMALLKNKWEQKIKLKRLMDFGEF